MTSTFDDLQSYLRLFNAEWSLVFLKADVSTVVSTLTEHEMASLEEEDQDSAQELSYLAAIPGSLWTVLLVSVGHYSGPGGAAFSQLFGEVFEYAAESTSGFEGVVQFQDGELVRQFATEDFEEFLAESEVPYDMVESLGEVFAAQQLPILPASQDQSFVEFLKAFQDASSEFVVLRLNME